MSEATVTVQRLDGITPDGNVLFEGSGGVQAIMAQAAAAIEQDASTFPLDDANPSAAYDLSVVFDPTA